VDDKKLNLIIIDDSFDTEEKVVSSLRNLGYVARSSRVEDVDDLLEAIESKKPEVIIYTMGMDMITLKQTSDCVKKSLPDTPLPIIAVDKNSTSDIVSAMRSGAADLSSYNKMDHLCLVIAREHSAFRNWQKTSRLITAFEESERRCSSLLDSSRDAIAYVHEGMHVYSNQSYLELFDIEAADELEGMPILDMVAKSNRDKFKTFLRDYLESGSKAEKLELQLNKPDGTVFSGEIELSPASIEGEPCVQIIIRQESKNSEELEAQLKLLSQQDQLTGLYNRQYCLEAIETKISECEKGGHPAAVIQIQLDNFENIKSQIGVVGSDKFIVAIANALKKAATKNDIVARYMHSSFMVLANNQVRSTIEKYAHKLQTVLNDTEAAINDMKISTTCTMGITLIDHDSPECNEILSRAEKASNEAIDAGPNQIKIYMPAKGELTRQEVDAKLKGEITEALKKDQFVLQYQPIVSLHGDTDERYEVFVRMRGHENDQLIMPQEFLPAAERIGMAIAIDRWVLYKTITLLTERWKSGHKTRFFIKLSASSLKDDTLIDWLIFQIKEKKLPEGSLIFTVKESVAVTHLKQTRVLSQKLKDTKCGFLLDDFGLGSNPFQLLDHIHADYIRLDKSFMNELQEDAQTQDAIKKIAEQSAEFGKLTIAQFVPDAASLSLLWGMGINFIQGYFLQEPSTELHYDFSDMSG